MDTGYWVMDAEGRMPQGKETSKGIELRNRAEVTSTGRIPAEGSRPKQRI